MVVLGIDKLVSAASMAASAIKDANDILIISHIDADGISSAAIASATCTRLGKSHTIKFLKKLTEDDIKEIDNSKESLVWICDLGSGYRSKFNRSGIVITDHHEPDTKTNNGWTTLEDWFKTIQVNPHDVGLDGSCDLCGAGSTYLVAREVDVNNKDLAHLAVVGACGDMQDSDGKLSGINAIILEDAVSRGDVKVVKDLRIFGRETRSLTKFLKYSSNPSIPSLSDNENNCVAFFEKLQIPLRKNGKERRWNDLDSDEKDRAINALSSLILDESTSSLLGDAFILPNMPEETELRDAKEYSTLLNSCGRYGDAETGMKICLGDKNALAQANGNRDSHRRNISSALAFVKDNHLLQNGKFIQYFDAGTEIQETVVGIVAGMLLNTNICSKTKPIIAFVEAEDGLKVSARADRRLSKMGLNLSLVMRNAAAAVGGIGGGHNVAAGATIPPERKDDFLEAVEAIVASQII